MAIRWSSIHEQLGVTPRDLDFALLRTAVDEHVVETESLDWKGAYPWKGEDSAGEAAEGRPRKPRNPGYEFAKDVAAMANTRGGLLVYGVQEQRGVGAAKDFDPVDISEGVQRRLRAFAFERIRPIVVGLEMFPLASDDGKTTVLVVSVPRSPDAPHVIGERHELGVPHRDGTETQWMREREIERAYRERFSNQEAERRQLGLLISDAAHQLDMDGKAWIVASARSQTPVPAVSASLSSAEVRPALEAVLRRTLEVVPSGHGDRFLLVRELGSAALNPRVGLRRWVARTTSTSGPDALSTYVHVELHHDGSLVLAVALEGWRPPIVEGVHQVICPMVESFAADFVALVESFGIRSVGYAPMSYQVDLCRSDDLPYEAIDRVHMGGFATSMQEVVPGSRRVRSLTPIMGEVPLTGDLDGLRDVATDVATGVLHQFGVERLTLLR
jgi:schlafen family protein